MSILPKERLPLSEKYHDSNLITAGFNDCRSTFFSNWKSRRRKIRDIINRYTVSERWTNELLTTLEYLIGIDKERGE